MVVCPLHAVARVYTEVSASVPWAAASRLARKQTWILIDPVEVYFVHILGILLYVLCFLSQLFICALLETILLSLAGPLHFLTGGRILERHEFEGE